MRPYTYTQLSTIIIKKIKNNIQAYQIIKNVVQLIIFIINYTWILVFEENE